jgi:hypothetical protein
MLAFTRIPDENKKLLSAHAGYSETKKIAHSIALQASRCNVGGMGIFIVSVQYA